MQISVYIILFLDARQDFYYSASTVEVYKKVVSYRPIMHSNSVPISFIIPKEL